jgi:hypothetical protein
MGCRSCLLVLTLAVVGRTSALRYNNDATSPNPNSRLVGDALSPVPATYLAPERRLQTPSCGLSTANGWWTDDTPPLPPCSYPGCASCSTTSRASPYTSATAMLYCNAGWTLSGTGTAVCMAYRQAYCTASYNCVGSWWFRTCSCAYSFSCSAPSILAVSSSGSCVTCNPAAITPWYANAPGWQNGVATYTWTVST